MMLALRGADVYGLDIVDTEAARPQWLRVVGGQYIDGRKIPADRVLSVMGPMEMVIEAAGVASLEFNLLDALGLNGVYVLTGLPGGNRPLKIPGAQLVRQLVLGNQIMLGSVNAARGHFQMAADDLARARLRWGAHVDGLITRYPVAQFSELVGHAQPDAIKEVITWASA
jgi:threonine dehydrogenase-like Zn-dependent dehydrogenase